MTVKAKPRPATATKEKDKTLKAFLDEIKIEKKIVLMEQSKIHPYENNAKKHMPEQVQAVANSIKRFGFNVPLIIDPKGTIIAGHCRYEAAKTLKLKSLPCIVKEKLTAAEIKSYRVADNKLNESMWDNPILYNEMADIQDPDLIRLAGFDPDDIGSVAMPVDGENTKGNENAYKYEIVFDNAEDFAKFGECVAQLTVDSGGVPVSKCILNFLTKNIHLKKGNVVV